MNQALDNHNSAHLKNRHIQYQELRPEPLLPPIAM